MIHKTRWVEVWIDSAARGDYALLLYQRSNGRLELIDPQNQRQVIQTFIQYQQATNWLNEDEYDLVEGHYELDEQ